MRRCAAGLGDDRDHVRERLAHLRDEVPALELLVRVPTDLAGDEHQPSLAGDAVGVALGALPMPRVEKLERRIRLAHWPACVRSRKRWILPVCVLGNASANLTERGYL